MANIRSDELYPLLSGKSCNGTAAPVLEDLDDDDWQAGTHDIIIEKETKKRKRKSSQKKPTKQPSSRKRTRDDEGMEGFDSREDFLGSEEESELDCDLRMSFRTPPYNPSTECLRSGVPQFVLERKKSHVPLSFYFSSVNYNGQDEDDNVSAEKAMTEEEEDDDDDDDADDESDTRSAPSSPAPRKKVLAPKNVPVATMNDESATGKLGLLEIRSH